MVSEISKKKEKVKLKLAMAKSVLARCSNKRPNRRIRSINSNKKNGSSVVRHAVWDSGYTVNLCDLLCTPHRDFLITNNGLKVKVDDLKGKTVVLYIFPIYHRLPCDELDVVEAYYELLLFGGIEFVFVPVYLDHLTEFQHKSPFSTCKSPEEFFDRSFSAIPFPAVPFSDIEACSGRVVETFSVDHRFVSGYALPYWVIIDPTSTVVATRAMFPYHFKLFGGAELHPLSHYKLSILQHEFGFGQRNKCRERLINKWDQLLASPTRDFLLSSSGDQVPISSLKGKLIGLYFCENVPHPPNMELIKKVYQEAKARGYDFEIVQINFHYHTLNAMFTKTADLSEQQRYENIKWLTLPFKDPSCRKLQRIFKCEPEDYWPGDCLVLVDARQAGTSGKVPFQFSGAELFSLYGIQGYPFTTESLVDLEYEIQKKEFKLPTLFPPGEFNLSRPLGDGSCIDGAQLQGKRVLVLYAKRSECESSEYIWMLESKYRQQLHDGAAEEDKFEVVYISTDHRESPYAECIKDMPWLVYPYWRRAKAGQNRGLFRQLAGVGAAAFDTDGELVAKECRIESTDNPQFPFISKDLKEEIRYEVDHICRSDEYFKIDYSYDSDDTSEAEIM